MSKLKLWKTLMVVSWLCLFANTWLWIHFTRKNGTEIRSEPKLIIAAVIFRHGDRNPMETFPTDSNKDISWPGGWGVLTQVGMEQSYELGAYLRRRYALLLGDIRSDDIVNVQSSTLRRTKRSAAACLAGLFGKTKSDQILNSDLSWLSIPIHRVPQNEDYILYPGKKCPRYAHAIDEYLKSPQFIALMARHKEMFHLPAWGVEALEHGDLKWAADHAYEVRTTLLARLYAGFLIREIVEQLQQKVDGSLSPDRSLFLYSGSGFAIVKVLNALQLFDAHEPPYGSSLHFEVYSSNDEYHMQIIYRNTDDENPCPLEIPSCGAKCSLEQFKSIYSAIIPTGTFDEECELS
ncbi:prostatic acid phosphatase-like [Sitodiplosis mosellana]|uniref:prostatic acid phosphatase-like n=1 Tax=Sitodiplosis mosellana TaxID=263140 RepID=UPI002443EE76|nr:prostatic acid phosphatase-like [Sitodiplosis mosellana]